MSSISTMMNFPLTLATVLERARRIFPHVEIVSRHADDTLQVTDYAGLFRRVQALAGGLQAAGLDRQDRVATLMWNHLEHLEAYFAVPLSGGVLHPLNLRLHPADLADIVADAGDRFLLVDETLLPLYAQLVAAGARFERVWVSGRSKTIWPAGVEPAEGLYQEVGSTADWPELAEDDAAAMGYTSGTTGEPKGVVYSHRALVLHALATALHDSMDLRQSDTVLPVVPMFHANGWGIPYTATMIGCRQVYPGAHPDGAVLLRLLCEEQVTFSAGVPTVWQAVLEARENEPEKWRLPAGLRINLGGAAAPESLFAAWDRLGVAINMGWGMTELTPVGAMNPRKHPTPGPWGEDDAELRTRQGIPLPLVEVRVRDGRGGEVPWDGISSGELELRGPWVAARYHRDRSPESWREDGWFRSGDVVNISAQGALRIVDRHKDLIRSGGEWISSVALENYLASHPAVREAAVVAVPHARWQERPLAVVVVKPNASTTPEELRQHLLQRFARWQCPDSYLFVDEIPHTSTGKLNKRVLREQVRSGTLSGRMCGDAGFSEPSA